MTKGKHRYLYSKNLDVPEVKNVMVHDKELFIKSIEVNPKVSYQKKYVNEETEQEIIYVHVKK